MLFLSTRLKLQALAVVPLLWIQPSNTTPSGLEDSTNKQVHVYQHTHTHEQHSERYQTLDCQGQDEGFSCFFRSVDSAVPGLLGLEFLHRISGNHGRMAPNQTQWILFRQNCLETIGSQ